MVMGKHGNKQGGLTYTMAKAVALSQNGYGKHIYYIYIYIYIYIYTQHSFLEVLVSRSARFYKGSTLEMNCATVEHA